MNKKDCMNIGYILSSFVAGEMDDDELVSEIGSLDNRIKEEFYLFGDCRQRDQYVAYRFEELMIKEFGRNWCLLNKSKEVSKRIWDQAESEIPYD